MNYLTEDFRRNGQIVGDLIQNDQHFNLILSDRLGHLEYLMNHLPSDLRKQAVMIDGKMTTKKAKALREQAIEDMRQEPICYDYVDDGIQYLVRSYKKRCTSYRKLGCKFLCEESTE